MANNTYWGAVPSAPSFIEPGDYIDNYGTENDTHAIEMGEVLVEGTLTAWREFAERLTTLLDEIEREHECVSDDPDYCGGGCRS